MNIPFITLLTATAPVDILMRFLPEAGAAGFPVDLLVDSEFIDDSRYREPLVLRYARTQTALPVTRVVGLD